jgi:hypothetical protein
MRENQQRRIILNCPNQPSSSDELELADFIEAVNKGIEDMKAGRGMRVKQAFAAVREELGL